MLHPSPPLWVPACAGMTGECAGMTVGVGLPQMGYDGRAQLIGLAGIMWCCAFCRLMFCSVKRISRIPAPTPTS